MLCSKCGKPLDEQATFCGECGNPVETKNNTEQTQSLNITANDICGNCGAELDKDSTFCGECGTSKNNQTVPVEPPQNSTITYQTHPQQPQNMKKKENLLPLIIALISVVVISAGVICYFLFWNNPSVDVALSDIKVTDHSSTEGGAVNVQTPMPNASVAPTQTTAPTNNPISYSAVLDVENKVIDIRAWYGETVGKLSNLSVSNSGNGIKVYYDGSTIARIDVAKGTDGINYERNYYYKNGNLYFVFMFNGNKENRFYFYNNTLFRWIDESKTKWDNSFDNSNYINWQTKLLNESNRVY